MVAVRRRPRTITKVTTDTHIGRGLEIEISLVKNGAAFR